jgi:hypothetical protein
MATRICLVSRDIVLDNCREDMAGILQERVALRVNICPLIVCIQSTVALSECRVTECFRDSVAGQRFARLQIQTSKRK